MISELYKKFYRHLCVLTTAQNASSMSMTDLVAISVETLRIDSGYSLEKEFIKLIRMNP